MQVKLISVTQPIPGSRIQTAEDLIAYAARVSNPSNQENVETAPKLLAYLIKHKHWSPFEMCHMTIEIQTSRAIAAQILRHRSFAFQEYSQRYAKASEQEIYPARRQDEKNRQNSTDDLPESTKNWFIEAQNVVNRYANNLYQEALEKGVAKEQARFLLPLNTKTTLYMSGSVRSWIHFLELRTGNGTQQEHMDIANAIKDIFCKEFPSTSKAMGWNNV